MGRAFEQAAESYDTDFTHTSVGRAQRGQVWHFLEKVLATGKTLRILELNAGTGEDAIELADRGHDVLATDSAENMMGRARTKMRPDADNLVFQVMDIRDLDKINEGFDMIFSNFGGLNCLSPEDVHTAMQTAKTKLNPGGVMVLVFMGRFCAWESLYFLVTLRLSRVFRRLKKEKVEIQLSGQGLDFWYYGPAYLKKCLLPGKYKIRGIGLFVPPSYLNKNFPVALIKFFNSIDRAMQAFAFPAYLSDHFLIEYHLPS